MGLLRTLTMYPWRSKDTVATVRSLSTPLWNTGSFGGTKQSVARRKWLGAWSPRDPKVAEATGWGTLDKGGSQEQEGWTTDTCVQPSRHSAQLQPPPNRKSCPAKRQTRNLSPLLQATHLK